MVTFNMCQFNSSSSLSELLDCCSDSSSLCWDCGWKEFLRRYSRFIYSKVAQRCASWRSSRVQRQLSDLVNEIVDAVLANLYKNDCQALRHFTAHDNERMFLAWLATICVRTTNRRLRALIRDQLIDDNLPEVADSLSGADVHVRWELYEMVVDELRNYPKRKTDNLERNIHLFQLYVLGEFSEPMIQCHPFIYDLGSRTVSNVVTRFREYLREQRNFLE